MFQPTDLSEPFRHSPLDAPQGSIRLIEILPESSPERIKCSLREESLSTADYVALSYQWGNSSNTESLQIELNYRPFRIRSNLYAFLSAACNRKVTDSLWIDAICIDQRNVNERNEQVKQMGKIFYSAREVWVWLGPDPVESHEYLQEMFNLSQPANTRDKYERARMKLERWQRDKDETWIQALENLCLLDYWNRLWIIQEFLSAKSILLWIAEDIFHGEDVATFVAESANSSFLYPKYRIQKQIRASMAYKLCKTWQGSSRLMGYHDYKERLEKQSVQRPGLEGRQLELVIANYGTNKCMDWHDTVYGLLALVENGERFPIDYSVGKISLLSEVLCFGDHPDWLFRLETAKHLSAVWNIPDEELICYEPDNGPAATEPDWSMVPLYIHGVIDRPSPEKPGQYIVRSRGRYENKSKTYTVSNCRCDRCSSGPMFTPVPGDEIFELTSFSNDKYVAVCTFIAFRRDSSMASGRQYLGAMSTHGSDADFLLHSLPYADSAYKMHDHVSPQSVDGTVLSLKLDPPTIYFLICTLAKKQKVRRRFLKPDRRDGYTWDHIGPS